MLASPRLKKNSYQTRIKLGLVSLRAGGIFNSQTGIR